RPESLLEGGQQRLADGQAALDGKKPDVERRVVGDHPEDVAPDHLVDVGVGPAMSGGEGAEVDQLLETRLPVAYEFQVAVEEDPDGGEIQSRVGRRRLQPLADAIADLVAVDD